jgi:hypothetical protein
VDWADVSPQRPGSIHGSVNEGLAANKMARTGFCQRALVLPVSNISPMFRNRSSPFWCSYQKDKRQKTENCSVEKNVPI